MRNGMKNSYACWCNVKVMYIHAYLVLIYKVPSGNDSWWIVVDVTMAIMTKLCIHLPILNTIPMMIPTVPIPITTTNDTAQRFLRGVEHDGQIRTDFGTGNG